MTKSLMNAARWSAARHCCTAALLLVSIASTRAAAQIITMKSLPIAEGDQFAFFPAANFGMGVSVAVPDSVHDPFVNPAKGARIGRSFFFGSPTAFSVSRNAGKGSTLPAGFVTRRGSSFLGAAVAIQSVTDGRRAVPDFVVGDLARSSIVAPAPFESNDVHSHSNRYGFLLAGHSFESSGLSLGGSVLWSGLGAIDGVNLLYPDSRSVSQSGGLADVRVGALKQWRGDQSLEALVLYRRSNMAQDVTYSDSYWDPIQHSIVQHPRTERDRERTDTRGLHLAYQRRLADSTWRIGALATTNLIDYPSTPSYEIATVSSDEGRATAFNLGAGVARTLGGTTYAIDAIYEPIIARLWSVADSATAASGGIAAGDRTADNRLRFANALLRAGVSHDFALEQQATAVRVQLGVQARSIFYTLRQRDLVAGASRNGGDSWMEWTRSWGATIRLPALEVQYRGRLTTGAGRPGVALQPVPPTVALESFRPIDPFPGSGSRATAFSGVSVTSHQLSISLPIR